MASGLQRLSLDDAVEEAICFGWIDSTLHPLDDRRYAVLFTPRRRGGTWSQANKATLWWVKSAKRSETRAKRIAESVRLAADNTTVLQR